MKVVVDTNVVVSRFLSPAGAPARVLAHWEQQTFTLLVSDAILEEYGRVLSYPAIQSRHRLSAEALAQILAGFRQFAVLVAVEAVPAVVAADPADDTFLACAVAGGADYVVSGDAHLLNLREYASIPILSPAAFLVVIEGTAGQ